MNTNLKPNNTGTYDFFLLKTNICEKLIILRNIKGVK